MRPETSDERAKRYEMRRLNAERYRQSVIDGLNQWIAECCNVGTYERAGATELYKSWVQWADAPQVSQKAFAMNLRMLGSYPAKKSNGGIVYLGIGVKGKP